MEEGRSSLEGARVAIVHDALYMCAGAERVLEHILLCFPDADLYALFDTLEGEDRNFLAGRPVRTTLMQKLPRLKRLHRHYYPLMPFLIEQLDLSAYDVIISSSHMVAKGILVSPDQLHISYIHSPMRYAWDLQHEYLRAMKLGFGPRGLLVRVLLHYMRMWDYRSTAGIDCLVTNSRFVARRVSKTYRRDAQVIYPPVDTEAFTASGNEVAGGGYFLVIARLVPYKGVRKIVRAFERMPDQKLVVVGTGPELDAVRQAAGPNVDVLGYQPRAAVIKLMQGATAFIHAAEEDFGVAPVEAQAAGTPVIAYGRGGLCEIVSDLDAPEPTGILFRQQTEAAIEDAVRRFLAHRSRISSAACVANARRFGTGRFRREFLSLVEAETRRFKEACANPRDVVRPTTRDRDRRGVAGGASPDPADVGKVLVADGAHD